MLTLSFIHATKKFKPKKMDRKTEKHSQENYPVHLLPGSNFQAKKHPPHRKPCVHKSGTKRLYTGEKMFVSAVPNEESYK